jgi:hypothetical protein
MGKGKKKNSNNTSSKKQLYKDGDFFEVEAIKERKKEDGVIKYFVKWVGWDDTDNTWEPIENLLNVKHLIKKFEKDCGTEKEFIEDINAIISSDLDIRENNDDEIEVFSELPTGSFSHDIPLKVVRVIRKDDGELYSEIEWVLRKSGIKPENDFVKNDIVKKKSIELLLNYYESRILIPKNIGINHN